MLKNWRKKVQSWTLGTRQLHAYVKNDLPAKVLAINHEDHITNDPFTMTHALNSFWTGVESWPSGTSDQQVWLDVEDSYALFLPHVPCDVCVTPQMLKDRTRYMKKASHGCDGWSIEEIRKLPESAWVSFLRMYTDVWPLAPPAQLTLKRRTPIEKTKSGVPQPSQVRPIDVFSVLLRLVASCICTMLQQWIRAVTHHTQTATHGGILNSVMNIACWTELALNKTINIYAVSLDLSMMFNMLSPMVSANLAQAAGLSSRTTRMLTWPILSSSSVWRLPANVPNPSVQAERGLPQGMASSVLFAELNVACLVHKLQACVQCSTVVYVDDISVITSSLGDLRSALLIVLHFVRTFRLNLSLLKSALWGTNPQELLQVQKEFDIKVATTLEAFGATWQVNQKERPSTVKEEERVLKVKERCVRISHLPVHACMRASVLSSTALSLLDYMSLTVKKPLQGLRSYVRKALSMRHGAPEIVYNMPTTSMLDPLDRNFLSMLRLWVLASNDPTFCHFINPQTLKGSQGRLGCVIAECKNRGIILQQDSIIFGAQPDATVLHSRSGWQSIRKLVIRSLKDLAFRNLQDRRPDKFAADFSCGWNHMRKFWKSLPSYEAATIMSIWSGSVMTASHRHTMDPTFSPLCACRQENQTLDHLMWRCPLHSRNRPMDLAWWAQLPKASSVSLVFPRHETMAFYRDWKRVCKWALVVVSRRFSGEEVGEESLDLPAEATSDMHNGHTPIVREDIGYVWCSKCFVTRKMRDRQFLFLKPCVMKDEIPTPEGHYMRRDSHLVRVILHPWKLHSWRPRMTCVWCRREHWATACFRKTCEGAEST